MIVGASKKNQNKNKEAKQSNEHPQPEDFEAKIFQFIQSRDYSGATTFIDFLDKELNHTITKEIYLWKGYALFHCGLFSEAIELYENLFKQESDDMLNLYISSCYFYLREYELSKQYAEKGPNCDFKNRLLFQLSYKLNDQNGLFQYQSQLIGTFENNLSLASYYYSQAHYQEALDIYQKVLLQHPDLSALNVYISMCQFKLDQFDESTSSIDEYLSICTDSAVALNIKSCNDLRLFDSQVAESQLLQIKKFSSASYDFVDSLIQHNLCIFHDGDNGFSVLPKLIGILPEARFNLATLYMRSNDPTEAFHLLQDFEPLDVNDSILKAAVYLGYGQLSPDTKPIEEANSIFNEIGTLDVVCDTVPGRECLISAKFIVGEYEEVLHIMQTIESLVGDTDEFIYNKAMSLAAIGRYAEAEKLFLAVKNTVYTTELFYLSWLCRCYIKNGKPDEAWNLYAQATEIENAKTLLQIIANDCYLGHFFFYSMKAYEILLGTDYDDPVFKQGMITSAVGLFRNILSKKESNSKLSDLTTILANEPEAAQVYQTINEYISNRLTDLDQQPY